MNLPIHAMIECTDGPCGRSIAVLLNPVIQQLTRLVVHEPGLLGTARMVPIEFVTESTPELIRLRCTKAKLVDLPPFVTTHYLPATPELSPSDADGVRSWPYVATEAGIKVDRENTDADELALHRGAHVHATDGAVGEAEGFFIDPADNRITHVIVRAGQLWGRQDTTIPVAQIDHIETDVVYLTLTKQQIAALPAIAVQRHAR